MTSGSVLDAVQQEWHRRHEAQVCGPSAGHPGKLLCQSRDCHEGVTIV